MLFICDVEGFAITFEDDHILTSLNVFDFFKLQKLNGTPTVCKIDVHGNLVICHSIPENQGRSIRNAAETLALAACHVFDIVPSKLIWVEHLPEITYGEVVGKSKEEWDRVSFNIVKDEEEGGVFRKPRWETITEDEVKLLITRHQVEKDA